MVATFMIYQVSDLTCVISNLAICIYFFQFAILFFGLSLRLMLKSSSTLRRNRPIIIEELSYFTQTDGLVAYKILTEFQFGLTGEIFNFLLLM